MIRRQSFDHVYWLGGAPGSEKSAIARLLAEEYDLILYRCDEHFPRHVEAADPREHPNLYRLNQISREEILSRPVEDQVVAQIAVYREQFPHIAEDLRAFGRKTRLLVEGTALLPEIVVNLIPAAHHALFLVPAPIFRSERHGEGEWNEENPAHAGNVEKAPVDRTARDEEFGRWVAATALHRGLEVMQVDDSRTPAETAARVARHFRFA